MNDENFLKKNGYIFKKNFFDKQDIAEFKTVSNKLHSYDEKTVNNLHNFDFSWKIITNSKLVGFLKKIYHPDKVYYLYNSHSIVQKKDEYVDPNWHRDNAHRIYGKGEDWKGDYNVLRVAIYLNENHNSLNGIKLIKGSHDGKGIICLLLRTMRLKLKRLYFNRIVRFFLDRVIGTTVKPKIGDCLFFYANTYHAALRHKGEDTRKALFLSYGTNNLHSDNFMNYYIFNHKGDHKFDIKKNNFKDFIDILNKNDLHSNLPTKRKIDKNFSI